VSPPLPRLLLITDWALGEKRVLWAVEQACAAGPGVAVQHRAPGAAARWFLDQARRLAQLCERTGAPLFINGRPDVARLLGAHLHLPSDGFPIDEARRLLPAGTLVSAAVHDAAEADAAAGADLWVVSPVFRPGSKAFDRRPLLGPEGFAALAGRAHIPCLALGGMDPERLASLEGARGAAVVSAVLKASDPRAAAGKLLAALLPPPTTSPGAGERR
jgi:thiamine-phosphate pyrophosphorylase